MQTSEDLMGDWVNERRRAGVDNQRVRLSEVEVLTHIFKLETLYI